MTTGPIMCRFAFLLIFHFEALLRPSSSSKAYRHQNHGEREEHAIADDARAVPEPRLSEAEPDPGNER
jgi:hypothetical protein